jgi:hypothetical protein
MSVHSFDRIPYCTASYQDGNILYEYRCQNCGIIYIHQSLLDGSDFEYNDYHSDIFCGLDIDEDATDDNE